MAAIDPGAARIRRRWEVEQLIGPEMTRRLIDAFRSESAVLGLPDDELLAEARLFAFPPDGVGERPP